MRNFIERWGADIIIGLVVLCFMAALIYFVCMFTLNPQIDRAVKQADEQTAKNWPEDRYGEIESFNGGEL